MNGEDVKLGSQIVVRSRFSRSEILERWRWFGALKIYWRSLVAPVNAHLVWIETDYYLGTRIYSSIKPDQASLVREFTQMAATSYLDS